MAAQKQSAVAISWKNAFEVEEHSQNEVRCRNISKTHFFKPLFVIFTDLVVFCSTFTKRKLYIFDQKLTAPFWKKEGSAVSKIRVIVLFIADSRHCLARCQLKHRSYKNLAVKDGITILWQQIIECWVLIDLI